MRFLTLRTEPSRSPCLRYSGGDRNDDGWHDLRAWPQLAFCFPIPVWSPDQNPAPHLCIHSLPNHALIRCDGWLEIEPSLDFDFSCCGLFGGIFGHFAVVHADKSCLRSVDTKIPGQKGLCGSLVAEHVYNGGRCVCFRLRWLFILVLVEYVWVRRSCC